MESIPQKDILVVRLEKKSKGEQHKEAQLLL